MDFGSLVLKTETDEKIEESNDLEKPEFNLKLDLPHQPGFGDVLGSYT